MPTKQSPQSKTAHRLALGIDPRIGNTGYAFVQRSPNRYALLHSGVIYTSPRAPLGYRLDMHYATIRELLTEHSPDLVSIESVFFNKNISSCLSTASVIAIAEFASVQAHIVAIQIKPQTVKAAVTGTGTASKSAVKQMVNKLLAVDITSDHEADAASAIAGVIALALCEAEKQDIPSYLLTPQEIKMASGTGRSATKPLMANVLLSRFWIGRTAPQSLGRSILKMLGVQKAGICEKALGRCCCGCITRERGIVDNSF